MLICDGIPTKEDMARVAPSEERLAQGPVAVLECFQEIPCDPCVKACNRGAITMPDGINDLPLLDTELCNGCGRCISFCPGLAIFIVDKTWSEERALIKLPYEYVPVPKAGQYVAGMDRAGRELGLFEVVKVAADSKRSMTCVISLAVPQSLAMEVRGIREGEREGS